MVFHVVAKSTKESSFTSSSAEVDTVTVISDENSQKSIISLSDSPLKSPSASFPSAVVNLLEDSDSDSDLEDSKSDFSCNPILFSSQHLSHGGENSSGTLAGPSTFISSGSQEEEQVKFENLTIHKWGTTAMWIGSVVIQVTKGDLAAELTDAIVAQTSNNFDLKGRIL